MNEQYFSVTFTNDNRDVCYGYTEYALLTDAMHFAHTMGDDGLTTRILLGEKTIVACIGDDEWDIVDHELYWQLTHWEANASWLYLGDGEDSGYGEFRSLGFFDSERDAVDYVDWLACNCAEHIAWDARMLGADAITLDVRAAGLNTFEYSIDVTADGIVTYLV